jgi:hypothetical protein
MSKGTLEQPDVARLVAERSADERSNVSHCRSPV